MAETPEFSGLPYGENQKVNDLVDEDAVDAELFGDDEEDYVPQNEDEAFLLSPTDRPDEPLTQGVPFGPGLDSTRFAFATDDDLLDRLAEKVRANAAADPQARAWAAQRAKGL